MPAITAKGAGSIEERLAYGRWYCGHYHVSKTIDKVRLMFQDFLSLS